MDGSIILIPAKKVGTISPIPWEALKISVTISVCHIQPVRSEDSAFLFRPGTFRSRLNSNLAQSDPFVTSKTPDITGTAAPLMA